MKRRCDLRNTNAVSGSYLRNLPRVKKLKFTFLLLSFCFHSCTRNPWKTPESNANTYRQKKRISISTEWFMIQTRMREMPANPKTSQRGIEVVSTCIALTRGFKFREKCRVQFELPPWYPVSITPKSRYHWRWDWPWWECLWHVRRSFNLRLPD